MPNWSRWFYDLMYRSTKPDWDSGVTPPEVVALVEQNRSRGRALDLGCGTGTNAIYLAQQGFIDMLNLVEEPLATLPESVVRPGREALEKAMEELR